MVLMTILMSATALAGGIFDNPLRVGEGIIVLSEKSGDTFYLFTYFDTSSAVPPVVSPPKPPLPPLIPCHNCPAWYIGTGGLMYMSQSLDYPNTLNEQLNEEFVFGTYNLNEIESGGYTLTITSNGALPDGMYMFNHVFTFTHEIAGD